MARALHNMGLSETAALQFSDAEQHLHQSLRISQRNGRGLSTAGTLANLANLAHRRGADMEAARLQEANIRLYRAVGNQRAAASGLASLAGFRRSLGDLAKAHNTLTECVAACQQVGFLEGLVGALEALAQLGACTGQLDTAGQAFAAAERARDGFDPASWEAFRELGMRQSLDEAIAQALTQLASAAI